jgi:ATP-dependent Clp protease ATP-binding subunit ClpA
MFERFTEKSIKVIMLAQEEARRIGHNYVSPEFLFLGLIGASPAIAANTLRSMGVQLEKARVEVENQIGRGSGYEKAEIPFTPSAKRSLESAWEESRNLQAKYIGTEHLLLGLLCIDDDSFKSVLQALGVTPIGIKESILSAIEKAKAEEDKQKKARQEEERGKASSEWQVEDRILEGFKRAFESMQREKKRLIDSQQFEIAEVLHEQERKLMDQIKERSSLIRLEESKARDSSSLQPEVSHQERASASTEKTKKVLSLAQEEARRLGHNFVGTELILLGLIGEGTGIAAKTLRSAGVNIKDARVEVEKIIGRGSGFVAVEIPYTPRAKRVLDLSWDEARQLGHNYIGTEHLLLGIIRERDGVAPRVLENLGLDLHILLARVLASMKNAQQ